MKLQVLSDERFSCRSCTDCCRQQFVELFAGEPGRIEKLSSQAGDALSGVKGLVRHGGQDISSPSRGWGMCVS